MEKPTTIITVETPDDNEDRVSIPVAVGKIAARRIGDYAKNKREGLPGGYVRDEDTAFVMAAEEDNGRSAAASYRKEAQQTEDTFRISGTYHKINRDAKQHQIDFLEDLADSADTQASKLGKSARRAYELGTIKKGGTKKSWHIARARHIKENPDYLHTPREERPYNQ